jgi:hypothetical protein
MAASMGVSWEIVAVNTEVDGFAALEAVTRQRLVKTAD